jgi:hypothetical protein
LFITLIAQSFLVSAATALGQRVYKKTRQDDFVDAVKVISALLSNIYFIGPALDTIIRNVTKGTYGKWDLSDPVSSTLNEARDAIEDVFLTIDQLKTKETYKAGMKKDEEKWKVSALRTASKIFTTAGRFTGIPTYNIRIGAEATLKHAFPDTEFAIESYARNPQTAYYYDLFWDYLERGNEKRAEDMMKILVKDLGITSNGFRTSYKSRRDDLPEDIWEKATKIYTNTNYGKRG